MREEGGVVLSVGLCMCAKLSNSLHCIGFIEHAVYLLLVVYCFSEYTMNTLSGFKDYLWMYSSLGTKIIFHLPQPYRCYGRPVIVPFDEAKEGDLVVSLLPAVPRSVMKRHHLM